MSTITAIASAPKSLPFLGHGLPMTRNPLGFLTSLPAYGDLVRIRLGPHSMVMVCDPALTRQVLLDDRTFDKGGLAYDRARELVGQGLAACPHSRHRRQRRLCQPAFRPDRMPTYAAVAAASADATARSWHDGQIIDVTHEMMTMTARTTAQAIFATGLSAQAVTLIVDDFTTILDGMFPRMIRPTVLNQLPTPGNRRYHHALSRLRHMVDGIIAARRADNVDHGDLLSSLQNAKDPDSPDGAHALSDTELADEVVTFLSAGTETTSSTIAWALYLLATHPQIAHRLHREVDDVLTGRPVTYSHLPALMTVSRVLTETLRLYPPTWLLTRTVTRDTELGGTPLPAGTTVALSQYLIHRRPDLHQDPDRFNPDRWLHTDPDRTGYLPFLIGARQCIGNDLALAEAAIALTTLTTRWRFVPLTNKPAQPSVKATLSPRGLRMRVLEAQPR